MSVDAQRKAFAALLQANESILQGLEQGASLTVLEGLFSARQAPLEALAAHPLDSASKPTQDERRALADLQMKVARSETRVAEAISKLVSSTEKLRRYASEMGQKNPGQRWDSLG